MGKKKNERFVTPAGKASYPYLTNPDTKFNPDGEYKVKLILPETEAKELVDLIDAKMEESMAKAKKDNPKVKKIKAADVPYSSVEDDEGDETGEIGFSFKQKAIITKKDGEKINMKVYLFDTKNKPVNIKGYVGGGSTIKVAFEIIPFYTKLIGAGVSLRLRAVQILDLVTGSSDGSNFGFGEEEDGFEGQPLDDVAEDGDPGPGDEDAPDDF